MKSHHSTTHGVRCQQTSFQPHSQIDLESFEMRERVPKEERPCSQKLTSTPAPSSVKVFRPLNMNRTRKTKTNTRSYPQDNIATTSAVAEPSRHKDLQQRYALRLPPLPELREDMERDYRAVYPPQNLREQVEEEVQFMDLQRMGNTWRAYCYGICHGSCSCNIPLQYDDVMMNTLCFEEA
ncbi:hypothetical protein BT63DRAFT_460089 [Microthyrium microscopicum]|uniref:Uncharacterized protein n=1 Tax=Microthyrium microscopicum TaxID=703497 RepID=A0A6A6TYU2_9PEZI|nr:hypothetical protein BT63DRAFT_460089 [Microthyrium microscopicum]